MIPSTAQSTAPSSGAHQGPAAADARPDGVLTVDNWTQRPSAENDALLRSSFNALLVESASVAPEERLIMYDAVDEHEVRAPLGQYFRKRIDARRNTKPKKPDAQRLVCTPFDPNGFNFGKIRNDRERIVRLALSAGSYDVLTNKFPLFPKHMLLVARSLVPQQMNAAHLSAITELLSASSFCAYFNSWCASASVNHFHCHIIDEFPPVTGFPLVAGPLVAGVRCLIPQGFPGFCYVFARSMVAPTVDTVLRAMQADNQPHNLLFTPRFIYVFPKPIERPARSFELYPETVGGPELIGSFTVYGEAVFDSLTEAGADELCRINTAPLPSRLLNSVHRTAVVPGKFAATVDEHKRGRAVDDDCVLADATTQRAAKAAIAPSLTLDRLPQTATSYNLDELHSEKWPQDRPIARSLMHNIGYTS